MILRKKDNAFRHYLKRKALASDICEKLDNKDDVDYASLPLVTKVFDVLAMEEVMKSISSKSNLYQNHRRIINFLSDTAGYLKLIQLNEKILNDLDGLKIKFPNFAGVIDFYKQQFSLSLIVDSRFFAANPLLILGPPGVGKTQFCFSLSQLLGTHFKLISMSSMTASFIISGNSSSWSEGKPGIIAETLAKSHCANSFVILDEIDKVKGDRRYDPLGALLQLLEKTTSKTFIDEALEVTVDCSHIVWVATANYLNQISEPILSRFTVIEVSAPNAAQMKMVVDSIYNKIRIDYIWGKRFCADLQQSLIDKIIASGLEPRLIQSELVTACGRAVLKARDENAQEKSLYEISADDFVVPKLIKPPAKPKTNVEHGVNVFMPIFNMPNTLQEPEAIIVVWSVREVSFGDERTRHLLGVIPNKGSSRITSAIQYFDRKTMSIKTQSGSLYQLFGQPGINESVENVWNEWKIENKATDEVDVTSQYCLMH